MTSDGAIVHRPEMNMLLMRSRRRQRSSASRLSRTREANRRSQP